MDHFGAAFLIMKRQRGRLVFQREGRPEIGAAGRANVAESPISPRFRVLISGAVSKVIHNLGQARGVLCWHRGQCVGVAALSLPRSPWGDVWAFVVVKLSPKSKGVLLSSKRWVLGMLWG